MSKPINRGWWDGTGWRKLIHDVFWYAIGIVIVVIVLLRLGAWFWIIGVAGR